MDAYRVLLLAPTRPDREATLELLSYAGIASLPCEAAQGAAAIEHGAGAIVMTDAAFADPHIDQLLAALSQQLPWSDVPIILLCRPGALAQNTQRVLNALRNVTLLERPTTAALVRTSPGLLV